jgi:hypothetical protein
MQQHLLGKAVGGGQVSFLCKYFNGQAAPTITRPLQLRPAQEGIAGIIPQDLKSS